MAVIQKLFVAGVLALFLSPHAASAPADATGRPVERIAWSDNILTLNTPALPGDKVDIWYLEAFCRTGSTDRVWNETVIPHRSELVEADDAGQWLKLKSEVGPGVTVDHEIRIVDNGVEFNVTLHNKTSAPIDIDWAQPCMRVGAFAGRDQDRYHERCFIFTDVGKQMLHQLPRNEEARYRGGQVYVPKGVNLDDVNPRPLSSVTPSNNLIGVESSDSKWVLAMAWDQTQELFQGVIVCIHADFRIGGLEAGETKQLKGKVYVVPNDIEALLSAYERDFDK